MAKLKTDSRLLGFARAMRQEPAKAERLLWAQLRGRKLNDAKFKRQVPIGGYIADFLCVEAQLIVELDGQTHGNRNTYDKVRDEKLTAIGFGVLRIPNSEIYTNLAGILETIRLRLPSPPPSPDGRGR